ncbi:hypothetical protein J8273_7029 [Carpediemonas membranifera]|uniref:Uncharacterized protein n=1 Tax=Carpediemonas membranifera TaxID=201153 RepID=A0A8J6DZR2_9EUKA|nr:hypothetical protein J8273_7029 [Carpediemonas membranifera]|eukprot:KAG9390776.1 hypothetical protein J8273_7029 [Carpediemonas membranifera]
MIADVLAPWKKPRSVSVQGKFILVDQDGKRVADLDVKKLASSAHRSLQTHAGSVTIYLDYGKIKAFRSGACMVFGTKDCRSKQDVRTKVVKQFTRWLKLLGMKYRASGLAITQRTCQFNLGRPVDLDAIFEAMPQIVQYNKELDATRVVISLQDSGATVRVTNHGWALITAKGGGHGLQHVASNVKSLVSEYYI